MGAKRKPKALQQDEEEQSSQQEKKRELKQGRKSKQNTTNPGGDDNTVNKRQKTDKQTQKKMNAENQETKADGDDEEDVEDDEIEEMSECKYKLTHLVTCYITLPTGDEEVITDYEMCFTDKITQVQKEQETLNEVAKKEKQENDEPDSGIIDVDNIEFEFKLQKLVNHIKKQGYPVENSFVSYYSADFQVQVNCGMDPISAGITMCPSDIEENQYSKELSIQLIFARGYKEDLDEVDQKIQNENLTPDLIALQRNKERSIGFIIEKVTQWRKLYNGFYDENHELKRMSLEQAATEVGVSKKSLDDYLSQIRQGRTNGFDFNRNKHQKVGKLRTFNKDIKKQQETTKK